MSSDQLAEVVRATLDEGKAEDITMIDLRGRASFADLMVVATGRSQRQLAALADHVDQKLSALGWHSAVEGLPQGDWVLIDAGDIIVHLFRPEVRSFYNLERMWGAPEPLTATSV